MCSVGGVLGDIGGALNPTKVLKNPAQSARDLVRATRPINAGYQTNKALGLPDYINGREDAEAAKKKMVRDAAAADSAAQSAATDEANAAIQTRRRRGRSSSLLARSGAGVQDNTSVLATAGSYGKTALGQ